VVDTVEKNLTDAAVAVAKTEAAALKSAEAAFAQASEAVVAPVKAVAATAPKAPAKAAPAKPAARKATKAKKSPARKPAKRAAAKRAAPIAKTTITKAPARAAAKTIKTGAKTMNTQTKKAAETGKIAAEQFTAVIGDVNARAKVAAEKTAKIVEELADLGRGNVEALVASSKIAAKGVEGLSQGAAEYGRKSFEDASAALKSFAEVKSATDFFRLQGEFARNAFDAAVAESARLSETVLKLAGDVAEPINSRYAVAAERVKTLAA
jgi:phasin family protein